MKPIKMVLYSFLIFLLIVLSSCKDREITNPFDAACPKEIFTPTDFKAEQAGSTVKLTWKQENTQISGFVINRNENDGAMTEVAKIDKSFTQWNDENTTADKKYGYQLYAYAGENLSNMLVAYCTPVNKTVVVTDAVSDITSTSAVFGGSVTNDSGLAITGRGVCYSTNVNPTTADNKVEMGSGSGAFNLGVAGLKTGTTYYVRAYAITKQGTSYGSQVTFTTSFLNVSAETNTMPKESGSKVITVASNTDWQVVSNQSWCTLNTNNGRGNGSVTLTFPANTGVPQRTVTITFTGTGVTSQAIILTQAGTEAPALTITPDNQKVTNIAGSTTFNITSNVSWTATCDQAWCTISNPSGTGNTILTVNYEANNTNVQRIANLSVIGLGLSAKAVTVIQQSAIPTNGLVAYYPFNGNANDESGNGNNGVVNGATLISDRKGNANSAFLFNGSNNSICCGTSSTFGMTATSILTIAVWVNPSILAIGNNCVFSKYKDMYPSNSNYFLKVSNNSLLISGNGTNTVNYNKQLNGWQFIVIIYNTGTNNTKIYLNGVVVAAGSLNYNSTISSMPFYIGNFPDGGFPFYGIIDDVRIYSRVLTETEIQQLYNE